MTDTVLDTRKTLLKDIAERNLKLHAELWETWKALDVKAQGTAATAGVFVAAIVAFSKDPPDSFVEKSLAVLALVALATAFTFALRALWIRDAWHAPLKELNENTRTLLNSPVDDAQFNERATRHLADGEDLWTQYFRDTLAHLVSKGWQVRSAQLALAVALGCSVVFSISRILCGTSSH